jgi:hypothetical protein
MAGQLAQMHQAQQQMSVEQPQAFQSPAAPA